VQDEPTPVELIQAVAGFLRADVAPHLSGHAAFKLRVALNALDLVARHLGAEQPGDDRPGDVGRNLADARQRLALGRGALSARIASGEMDAATPGLVDHLWQTTLDKLAVDQPNYAAYRRERGEG